MIPLVACGHGQEITRTTVAACDGAAVTVVGRTTWAAVADYDRDGDTDLLVLDVHAREPATGSSAAVVPLRATSSGYCQDTSIPVWTGELAVPGRMRLYAQDVDADGLVDLVVWSSATGDFVVSRGTGDPRARFTPDDIRPAGVDLGGLQSRQRWESIDVDSRGRLNVTTRELRVVLERGQRPPASGRRRHPTPFRVDYAVFLDFTLVDTYGSRTLVVGRGSRLAIRKHQGTPYQWHVLRLQ